LAARAGLPPRRVAALLALVAVAAVAGAKVYGVIERGGGFYGLRWELATGYRYPGSVIAVLVAMPLLGRAFLPKGSLLVVGDLAAAGVGIPIMVMRIGCFLAGCCHGVPSSLPWAVQFPAGSPAWDAHVRAGLIAERAASSLPVHPLQLYFGLASLGITALLLSLRSRQRYPGQLILLFFVLDGTAKFLLEYLRFDYAAHLQWMAAGSAVAAGVVLAATEAARGRDVTQRPRPGTVESL
jgi:phosphatidylglycerol:prolipoprotein diacylglycerol transferase